MRFLIYNLIILSYTSFSQDTTWVQMGTDIFGAQDTDKLGKNVSISKNGNIMAVAADRGYINIYEFSSNTNSWILFKTVSGNVLSLSGDGNTLATAFIGTDNELVTDSVQNDNLNKTKIYRRTSSSGTVNWNQKGQIIFGEKEGDYSGTSLSLNYDGSILAIGAPNNDGNGGNSGHTRIYQYQELSNNQWIKLGSDIDGEAIYDNSGNSVSINADGNIVAIGAHNNDGNGNNSGHVRVFKYDSLDWVQLGADIDGESENDKSGSTVSINADGSVVAIGAPFNAGDPSPLSYGSGHVRVYKFNGNKWSKLGKDLDGKWSNLFGSSISLSDDGKIISVGSPHFSKGLVEVFQYIQKQNNLDDYWMSRAYLPGKNFEDFSGVATSLSGNGSIVVSSSMENDENGKNSGHVRVYQNPNLVPNDSSNVSIHLLDNDSSFVKNDTINESDTIDIYLKLSVPPNAQDVVANLTFSGSATISDYIIPSNSITYPYSPQNILNNITSLSLISNKDSDVEIDETLVIGIESVINGVKSGTQEITIVIRSDNDGDGVIDSLDICSDTPDGEIVDENGCSNSQYDDDGDGVINGLDSCPETSSGDSVDENGCSNSQKDTDNDGVTDDLDICSDTSNGDSVDANGCSEEQKDSDGDGITDDIDTCPNSPNGAIVDVQGCQIPLSIENSSLIDNIFPNPTKNNLKLILKQDQIVKKIYFVNYSGQIFSPKKVNRIRDELDINISNLNNGAYILEIITEKERNKIKVVIER